MVETIFWDDGKVRLVDQTLLPSKFKYISCRDVKSLWHAIKRLQVRGAPAIGIAGALGVILGIKASKAKDGYALSEEVGKIATYLASSRPTAVNLFWALARMKRVAETNKTRSLKQIKNILLKEALKIIEEDKKACRQMARYGAALINKGDAILTHCNAGGLATADYGTALGVLFEANKQGKRIRVFADETRPILQGARLTTWELMHEGIDTTLICDNMAASLMAKGRIDKVFVGADRIASNGDAANKIGTYNVAVLARHHKIPFYVVAPISTFDRNILTGQDIPIEERDGDEVRTLCGKFIAPKNVKVYNPAFDVTPNEMITAIVTERGIFRKPYRKSLKQITNNQETITKQIPITNNQMTMKICDIGEMELIKRISGKIRLDRSVIKGIGDDTAVIRWTNGKYMLFTCDMLIEDTHFWFRGVKSIRQAKFFKKATPFQIGWKAMARNLSDIAAMGGLPRYALVSIGLDPDLPVSFADGIFDGMNSLAKKFNVNIVGGDTVKSSKVAIDISLIGEVEKGVLTLRNGAREGDAIFVTGFIGGSIKGKHLNFIPRLEEARALVKNYRINSMIDISDGLFLDLGRVLDSSKAGALLYEDLIPISRDASSFEEAVTDGEDFELLFTISPKEAERFMKSYLTKVKIPVSLIGEVTSKRCGYRLIGNDWRERRIGKKGFLHF